MQIVIDKEALIRLFTVTFYAICGGDYRDVKNTVIELLDKVGYTPLPKGHGRLKDIDKIEWYGCTTAFDCPHKDRECKDCDRAECGKTQVDAIPTIIEAESEE